MTHSSRKTYKDLAIRGLKTAEEIEQKHAIEKKLLVESILVTRRTDEGVSKLDRLSYKLAGDTLNLMDALDALNGVLGVTYNAVREGMDTSIENQPIPARLKVARETIQAACDIIWYVVDEWDQEKLRRRSIDDALALTDEALISLKKTRREAFVLGDDCTRELTERMDEEAIEAHDYSPTSSATARANYIRDGLLNFGSDN